MKTVIFICIAIFVLSCGTNKEQKSVAETKILYANYHSEIEGMVQIDLISSSNLMCSANIIQLSCDSYSAENLILSASNGKVTLKLLDEKSYYFTPYCNGKKVKLNVHYIENGEAKLLAEIEVKVSK